MRRGLICLCLLVSTASIAQEHAALTVFKVAYKKKGSNKTANKVLYEVKPNEIILVDDGPNLKYRIFKNEGLRFSKISIEDSVYALDISRKNLLLVGMGKFALVGSLMGIFGGSLISRAYSNPQNRSGYNEDLASGALAGLFIGIISSPVSLV